MIFNRFVKDARRCAEEARLLGHDSVGDEDLLLGILHTDEGPAVEALSTLEGVRQESETRFSEALSSIGTSLEEVRRMTSGRSYRRRMRQS